MEDQIGVTEQTKSQDNEATDIFEVKRKHKELADYPYLKTHEVTGNYDGEDPYQESVLTSQIIASPSLDNWADEYHGDWAADGLSSVEVLSEEILKNQEDFWKNNQHEVKLTKIDGPKGPIYAVGDGSHRVAAAKLAEALEIPAEVSDLSKRKEYSTTKETDTLWWQALIESGAIKGEINRSDHEMVLVLNEAPELPWIIRSRTNFVKVNKVYREIYGSEAFNDTHNIPDSMKDKLFDNSKLMVWENTVLRNADEVHKSS